MYLILLCSHDLRPGKQYEITSPKDWVKTHATAIQLTCFTLKLAVACGKTMGWPLPSLSDVPGLSKQGASVAQAVMVVAMQPAVMAKWDEFDGGLQDRQLPELADALEKSAQGQLHEQEAGKREKAKEATGAALTKLRQALTKLDDSAFDRKQFGDLHLCLRDTAAGVEVGWVHEDNKKAWEQAGEQQQGGGRMVEEGKEGMAGKEEQEGAEVSQLKEEITRLSQELESLKRKQQAGAEAGAGGQFTFTAQKKGHLNTSFKTRVFVADPTTG